MTGTVLRDGDALLFTIHHPETRNALNDSVHRELKGALDAAQNDAKVRSIVITGSGSKVFVSGSDIRQMAAMSSTDSLHLSARIARLDETITNLRVPVICAINGWCLGGGLELALACDIRVAADHVRLGFPEARLGITTGGGGIPRLVRVVGGGIACEMLLTGANVSAQRAYEVGLVTTVMPYAELHETALAIAHGMHRLGPMAIAQIKRVIRIAESSSRMAGVGYETQACAVCFGTEDKH